jgi:cytochrome c oxidase subunit 4
MDLPVSIAVFILSTLGKLSIALDLWRTVMADHSPEIRPGQHIDREGLPTYEDHGDHGGLARYVYVFVALCVLTSASFFASSEYWPWHDEPHVGWTFMLAVSCTKAMLVILFFMHVKYEANWKYVLTIPAALMSVFLMLMLVPDIGMRVHGLGDFSARYSSERLLRAADEEDLRLLQSSASQEDSARE